MTRISVSISEKQEVKRSYVNILKETPDELKVELRQDGQLWASRNGDEIPVQVMCCFPWSDPGRFVSLRDDDEEEFALVEKLSDLDSMSREAVEKALAEAGFVLEVEKVISTEEDYEIRTWDVMTRQGQRKFQTLLDEWPLAMPDGGILIRDIGGDLFFIREVNELDDKSKKLLWAFVD